MEPQRFFPAFLLAILAVFCIIPAYTFDEWPARYRILLGAIGYVFLLGSIVLMFNWIMQQADSRAWHNARANAITPETEVLRLFASLQPFQVEAYLNHASVFVAEPGLAGATLKYNIDGKLIPVEFVQEFLSKCSETNLFAERNYSDGSFERSYAQAITEWCIVRKIADPAVGNQSARWRIPKREALRQFNLIDDYHLSIQE